MNRANRWPRGLPCLVVALLLLVGVAQAVETGATASAAGLNYDNALALPHADPPVFERDTPDQPLSLHACIGSVGSREYDDASKFACASSRLGGYRSTPQSPTLFRGTSDGFPGSPGTQRIGITPTSTDPVVATAFATHADEFGPGVLHVARPADLAGVKTHRGLLPYESEIGVELLPVQFAARASTTVSSAHARSVLVQMGITVPSRFASPADLTAFLRGRSPLSPAQTQQFLGGL